MVEIHSQWPQGRDRSGAGEQLPEEGLEPTRTYAQALLRRPRLPFRHSGLCARRVYPSTLVGNLLGMFPSKDLDDRDLVGRARRGDREAFTQLIVQYQVPLYNMALRMVGGREDAADISQEAFLRAWEKIRSLRDAPFKSWLFQIAANLCYDHFRRNRRYGTMPDDERSSFGLGIVTPDPQERAEAGERNRLVRESIEALDHDMRIAIVLRDVNGMAYDEIAGVLRVPLGTVKSRIARARAQVQERLQQHPEFFPREDARAE